jgi:hypothetical protein
MSTDIFNYVSLEQGGRLIGTLKNPFHPEMKISP